MDYQPAKFQCCRLSLANFIDKLRKNNDDVIMMSFDVVCGFENLKFVKLNIGYHPCKFQISWLSGSNFMEVISYH